MIGPPGALVARARAARRLRPGRAGHRRRLQAVRDEETLSVADLLDAGKLAERHEAPGHQTVAERAAADRTWTFGHVIVDEAQELSQLAWRLLARRCPARSMTIVGDVAQTSGPGRHHVLGTGPRTAAPATAGAWHG